LGYVHFEGREAERDTTLRWFLLTYILRFGCGYNWLGILSSGGLWY